MGGVIAVELFFIISGFYMALILNEKYNTPSTTIIFYKNRFLKLFPIYWTILILTITVSIASFFIFGKGGVIENIYNNSHTLGLFNIYIFLSNIFLLGEDLLMFLGISNDTIIFTKSFSDTNLPMHKFIIIPQSWTLSLEIMFYIIAPFIARKKLSFIISLFILSFLLKIFLYQQGFQDDPWRYRFILSEFQFFFIGMIIYRVYKNKQEEKLHQLLNNRLALVLLVFIFLILGIIYTKIGIILYPLIILNFIVMLPLLFEQTKNNKIDRFIGELSYPVYIVHIFVIMFISKVANDSNLTLLTIMGSILFSIILNKYIQKRVEKVRLKNIQNI
jgi:peptidoglycan/LPS O-acetylase OafA/YrhL